MANIEQTPLVSSVIRDGAVTELDHVSMLIANLSSSEWSRPSAVEGWTIGDVATHLDLVVGLYSPFLRTVLAGGGSSRVAKAIGWLTGSILPTATPILDMINGVIPKAMNRVLPATVVKRQFAAGARKTRKHLLEFGPDDYARPEGGPYPLWFYLAIIVNELAIHGWDIESRTESVAGLSDHARRILPWFYWSGTALMFRPSKGNHWHGSGLPVGTSIGDVVVVKPRFCRGGQRCSVPSHNRDQGPERSLPACPRRPPESSGCSGVVTERRR